MRQQHLYQERRRVDGTYTGDWNGNGIIGPSCVEANLCLDPFAVIVAAASVQSRYNRTAGQACQDIPIPDCKQNIHFSPPESRAVRLEQGQRATASRSLHPLLVVVVTVVSLIHCPE